jgi:hypothetical protein
VNVWAADTLAMGMARATMTRRAARRFTPSPRH